MKRTIITIALFAVLGTLAVSCQKENILGQNAVVAENGTMYTVSYTVDGVTHKITLVGEDAWHDFLHHMIALAEEGHRVSFRNEEAASNAAPTKETVTYTTTNHDDAYKWAEKKINEGYSVTIEYDDRTGIYTCTAIK